MLSHKTFRKVVHYRPDQTFLIIFILFLFLRLSSSILGARWRQQIFGERSVLGGFRVIFVYFGELDWFGKGVCHFFECYFLDRHYGVRVTGLRQSSDGGLHGGLFLRF